VKRAFCGQVEREQRVGHRDLTGANYRPAPMGTSASSGSFFVIMICRVSSRNEVAAGLGGTRPEMMMVGTVIVPLAIFWFAAWEHYGSLSTLADERIARSLDVAVEQPKK
jgi:hypothetical protein